MNGGARVAVLVRPGVWVNFCVKVKLGSGVMEDVGGSVDPVVGLWVGVVFSVMVI